MYHISDLKKFNKCNRLYYLDLQKEKTSFHPYLRSDVSYTDLLSKKFKADNNNSFYGETGQDPSAFLDNLNNYEWFINARVEYGELRVKIPFLHKLDDCFELYFCYRGVSIKDLDFFSYKITLDVLSKLGIKVNKAYICYINPDYVFHKEIDFENLFLISETYRGEELINVINSTVVDYEEIINIMNNSSLDVCLPQKARVCHARNICDHYASCFPKEKEVEEDSILTLVSSQYKTQMYDEGIVSLKDADISRVEGNRVQYAQIMASRNNGLFIDRFALDNFMEPLKQRPISYVDFEWDRYLIPAYEGMKPLDVIPFEYVLYVDNGKEIEHKVFISSGDCREEFVKRLIEDIPKSGPVCAYNATGAEIIRLQELAEVFPQYKKQLYQIINRFKDLATPFVDGLVYDTRMAGNYSLKKLVSVVSDMSYKDLDVNDGMKAVYSWRDIDNGKTENAEKIIDDLKKYCSLDAYGLVLVHKWLDSLK